MIPVVCPAYLPNVQYFQWLLKQEKVCFSSSDHYQKQTFRNRTAIYGANGKLNLTIPIAHHSNTHVHDIDVVISDTIPWQQQHWKSFCAAYRSAPFFEFYEDAFYPFYHRPQTCLFEFNINLIEEILTLLLVCEQHRVREGGQVLTAVAFTSEVEVFSSETVGVEEVLEEVKELVCSLLHRGHEGSAETKSRAHRLIDENHGRRVNPAGIGQVDGVVIDTRASRSNAHGTVHEEVSEGAAGARSTIEENGVRCNDVDGECVCARPCEGITAFVYIYTTRVSNFAKLNRTSWIRAVASFFGGRV